ncbi:MAG: flagellar motor switch protein FliG [Desulfobacterales bacterium]|nr:flagellar motor switch protein FliG [Desulfobacterales bacterium]
MTGWIEPMDTNNLAGSIKVAILIQALESQTREGVLQSLKENDRKKISDHLAELGPVSPDLVEKVAKEFARALKLRKTTAAKPPAQLPGSTKKANENKAKSAEPGNLNSLLSLDPDHLAQLIRHEHPQTIAVILVHLKTAMASEVLGKLPEDKRTEVALRIASSEKIVSGMIEEIEKAFQDVLAGEDGATTHKIGGVGRLAEILNQIDGTSAQMILDEIEEDNPELAAQVKQLMFVFEDLVLVDDKGLQALLRKVETRELAVALKAASEEVKDKIFQNMSTRAADMVMEEIEAAGSVRMREVENAQQAITKLIQDMEEKGELIISGRGGEEFIA